MFSTEPKRQWYCCSKQFVPPHQVNFSCPITPQSCQALFQEFWPYYTFKFLHIKAPMRILLLSRFSDWESCSFTLRRSQLLKWQGQDLRPSSTFQTSGHLPVRLQTQECVEKWKGVAPDFLFPPGSCWEQEQRKGLANWSRAVKKWNSAPLKWKCFTMVP